MVALAFVAAGWAAAWILLLDVRRLPTGAAATGSVTVVVPARDEAGRLPRLLHALWADAAVREVIVVDDESTDGTAAVARAAGATVVDSHPPAGWTGKSWACWTGARAATGAVVVFLDADTEPAPGFVGCLAGRAERHGALVSVQPLHRTERAVERLSAVASSVAVLASGTGAAPRAGWRRPVAYGPAVGVPRRLYLDHGGHGRARSAVAEDLALARAMALDGVPVEAWAGGGITYRMYPDGLGQLVEGWSKNLQAGAAAAPPARVALTVLWIAAALRVAVLPFTIGAIGLGAYALFAVQAAVLFRRVGRFGASAALLFPIPAVTFVALFARSLWSRLAGRPVSWRGRVVPQEAP
jgi:4,4'-diaponeurosporenoate glycosyltransferase